MPTDTKTQQFYIGVIIFLGIALVLTLLFFYLGHRTPTVTPTTYHFATTPTTHKVPFHGTYQVTTVTSPDSSADVDSIIQYLQRRGVTLAGQPFNSDIYKSLTTPWLWQWNRSVNPPVGIFPPTAANKPTLYIVFNAQRNQWDLTTISPWQQSL